MNNISPVDADRMELWQAYAVLGQHRHPDYWLPDRADHSGGDGSGIGSRGGPDIKSRSADLFAARRAAARGDAPPPEARDLGADAVGVAAMLRG